MIVKRSLTPLSASFKSVEIPRSNVTQNNSEFLLLTEKTAKLILIHASVNSGPLKKNSNVSKK